MCPPSGGNFHFPISLPPVVVVRRKTQGERGSLLFFPLTPYPLLLTSLFSVARQLRGINPDKFQNLIPIVNDLVKLPRWIIDTHPWPKGTLPAFGHKYSSSRNKEHDLLFVVMLVLRHHSPWIGLIHAHGEIL